MTQKTISAVLLHLDILFLACNLLKKTQQNSTGTLTACSVCARTITFNGGAFGQDSDCSHCYILELVDGAALGPPAVRSNPQEMAHLIGPLGGIENSPARTFAVNLESAQVLGAICYLLNKGRSGWTGVFGLMVIQFFSLCLQKGSCLVLPGVCCALCGAKTLLFYGDHTGS